MTDSETIGPPNEVWLLEREVTYLNDEDDIEATNRLPMEFFGTKTLALSVMNKMRDAVLELRKLTPEDSQVFANNECHFDVRVGHNRYDFKVTGHIITGDDHERN